MRKLARDPVCPCGSRQPYSRCCQPYHQGQQTPESPLRLFLARYCAYVLGDAAFIIQTTHPQGPIHEPDQEKWRKQIVHFHKAMAFLGHTVFSHTNPPDPSDDGVVVYRVSLRERGVDASFVERAVFKRLNGQWRYHSGEFLATDAQAKTWQPPPADQPNPQE